MITLLALDVGGIDEDAVVVSGSVFHFVESVFIGAFRLRDEDRRRLEVSTSA